MFYRTGSVLTLLALLGCSADPDDPSNAFEVRPDRLDFGVAAVGERVERAVVVENLHDRPLVLAIEDPGGAFTADAARLAIDARASASFTVVFLAAAGRAEGQLRLVPEDAAVDPRIVPLVGAGRSCGLTTTATVVDFGRRVRDEAATESLTFVDDVDEQLCVSFEGDVEDCAAEDAALCAPSMFDPRAALELVAVPTDATHSGSITVARCGEPACNVQIPVKVRGAPSRLACAPAAVDFGDHTPGRCAVASVTCANATSVPVAIDEWAIRSRDDAVVPDFTTSPSAPTTLAVGAALSFEVRYCPGEVATDAAALEVTADGTEVIEVRLDGRGGGPELVVDPLALDFGEVALIAPRTQELVVRNIGDRPLVVESIDVDVARTGAFSFDEALPPAIPPSGAVSIPITFAPTAAGPVTSTVRLTTNDEDAPSLLVELEGVGVDLPPCDALEVRPSTLALGDVEIGRPALRTVVVANPQATDCIVGGVALAAGSAFSLLGADELPRRLRAGSAERFDVRFQPESQGVHSTTMTIDVASTVPNPTLSLVGHGVPPGLFVSPEEVDFGVVAPTCSTEWKTITIDHLFQEGFTIDAIGLLPESDPAFTLRGLPALPMLVQPATRVSFEVELALEAAGSFTGAVAIDATVDGVSVRRLVSLRGLRATNDRVVQRFTQGGASKVDVLFVLDDSGSPRDELLEMAAELSAFLEPAPLLGSDFHIGVTTTDTTNVAGALFVPFDRNDPRFVGPATPDAEDVLARKLDVGIQGSGIEHAFLGGYLALASPRRTGVNAGFSRPDADLALIFVTDEREQSPGTVELWTDAFRQVVGTRNVNRLSVSSVAGDVPSGCDGPLGPAAPATRLASFTERFGGTFHSICTQRWQEKMAELGATAFGMRDVFFLDNRAAPSSVEVRVDGQLVPAVTASGTMNWQLDYPAGAIRFTPFATPEAGADVDVTYRGVCR